MRQYIASAMPDKNGNLTISGKDFKYLCQVLRISQNDIIQVRLPDQQLVPMEVFKLQAKQLILTKSYKTGDESLGETGVSAASIEESAKNNIEFVLFQFLPKSQKMDLIVRQAVECGISQIVPIQGEYSLALESSAKLNRWERIIKEARQQSGSPVNTKIEEISSIKDAMKLWNETRNYQLGAGDYQENDKNLQIGFLLHEKNIADKSIFSILNGKCDTIKRIGIAVGCEGGMSDEEISILKENGFELIHFETNVLRAETASIYGIAAIQNAVREYEIWHTQE